jgi:uncharacterized OB-fold protein
MMAEYKKQLPLISIADKPFWDAARRHELMAYQCQNCGTYYSLVVECVNCSAPKMEWVKVSGKGKVFTYTIYHQLYNPAWKDDIPYNAAWVQLDEGPLMVCNIVDVENEDIYVDMPVVVTYDDITEEVTLPKFKPVM